MTTIDTLKKQRDFIHRNVTAIPEELLLKIPRFRKNNIVWNLGHIVTVQQTVTYGLSKAPLRVPEHYYAWYFRDTSPADWTGQPDVPKLLEDLLSLPEQFEKDYNDGVFSGFTPYTTVTGVYLASIEEAIAFSNFHEGIHTGIIFSIQKELEAGA
jgi:hypothetical protein